jgi:cellulose synthase/poly-beta-1,6-N-acetylglucosamine synthase-like glycosyltransferase
MMVSATVFWLSVFTVAYVYLLYPLLVALLARLSSKPVARDRNSRPAVTLLIAAYNEERCIARKLENSLALDYPSDRLQIMVVADGSTDRTADAVREFAGRGVELLFEPERRGKMAAINRAMKHVRGEIVVFSDANNTYDALAIQHLVAPFADDGVGAVSGAKVVVDDDRPLSGSEGVYWRYESFIKKQETRLGSCVGAVGEILAIRRSLFVPPPRTVINDDFYMCMQIAGRGLRVVYCPEARSVEYASASVAGEIVRRTRIIAGRYQAMLLLPGLLSLRQPLFVWQVVSHKLMRPLVPFAMLGAVAGNLGMVLWPAPLGPLPFLRGNPPWGEVILALQAAFYVMALVGAKARIGGWMGKILHIPAFLVQSNYAALLGLLSLLKRGDGVLWKKVERADESPEA